MILFIFLITLAIGLLAHWRVKRTYQAVEKRMHYAPLLFLRVVISIFRLGQSDQCRS